MLSCCASALKMLYCSQVLNNCLEAFLQCFEGKELMPLILALNCLERVV